jgi:hypothetical protein
VSESAKNGDSSWWSNAGGLIAVVVVLSLGEKACHSTLRYAAQYHVSYDQVTVDKQPHDCEWLTAPLGDKNCHYDAEARIIRTGHREGTGQPVVSFDDGKTWEDNSGSKLSPAVYITWKKIED